MKIKNMDTRTKKTLLFIASILVTYIIFSICIGNLVFITNWELKHILIFCVCAGAEMAVIDEGVDWMVWRQLKKINNRLNKLIEETKEAFNNRSFKNNQDIKDE